MDDFFVDDITEERPKRMNTGKKGKRVERELCKVFNTRFMKGFSRTVGSGNRWSQSAHLTKEAMQVYTGDLVCPAGFKFCIESKGGYDDVDLSLTFLSGHAQLDEFIKQSKHESQSCGRKPLICWKRSRRPWLAIIQTEDLPNLNWPYRFIYNDWSMVALDLLLDLPDDYWFNSDH